VSDPLQRVAAGDGGAVEEVLDRYGGLVWSLARRLTDNAAEAEDAVQEIFIDIWRSASRFDPSVASESTFIAMIARRRLIDRRRKRGRQRDTHPLPERLASDARTGQEEVEISDEASRAADALEQIRPEQKKVLELSIYQGLTHDQISRKTGMPLGTVKTHARRGLIRVRELLKTTRSSTGKGVSS
jgi:RNA polymerase sigma-70 factor (ECF subfamily)